MDNKILKSTLTKDFFTKIIEDEKLTKNEQEVYDLIADYFQSTIATGDVSSIANKFMEFTRKVVFDNEGKKQTDDITIPLIKMRNRNDCMKEFAKLLILYKHDVSNDFITFNINIKLEQIDIHICHFKKL